MGIGGAVEAVFCAKHSRLETVVEHDAEPMRRVVLVEVAVLMPDEMTDEVAKERAGNYVRGMIKDQRGYVQAIEATMTAEAS